MPNVSIVTVCYNYGHYLPECMHSVQAQTYRDFEHIVVDPGSKDDTGKVVEEYKGWHLEQKGSFGLSRSKNWGIIHSRNKPEVST